MRVRDAEPDDAEAIAEVHVASWRAGYRGLVPDEILDGLSVEQRTTNWRGWLTDRQPRSYILVADADDGPGVHGFVSGGRCRDAGSDDATGEVNALYAAPAAWGRGVGRALLRHAEVRLWDAGFTQASLWVLAGNARGRHFYESAGWQPDGAMQTEAKVAHRPEHRYRVSLGPTPPLVRAAHDRADTHGFSRACLPAVGRVLRAFAAAVPAGGRVLELGTGVGVGTAWLADGLATRPGCELVTVDVDATTSERARTDDAGGGWPPFVRFLVADAVEAMRSLGRFDLVFADAPAGKWTDVDVTLDALGPGGVLVVDDMWPRSNEPGDWRLRVQALRQRLVADERLATAELADGSGVVIAVRRR